MRCLLKSTIPDDAPEEAILAFWLYWSFKPDSIWGAEAANVNHEMEREK